MKFNKIMVALDLSAMDENLIRYSQFIGQNYGTTIVDFVHTVPFFIAPTFINENLEVLIGKDLQLKDRIRDEMTMKIQPFFDTLEDVEAILIVLEGKPLEKLLAKVQEEKPDLLVLGKKRLSGGSGVIARRVARKAKSAIWFVTEKAKTNIQKILVPLDFSDNSFRALKAALDLKTQLEDVTINVMHVIDIPMTAYKINRNKEAIVAEMKETATNKFLGFLSRNHVDKSDLNFQISMNDEFDVAHYIQEIASQEKSDLIIIGGKGQSRFEDFLFGSVTEKLVTYEYDTPILVVR